jgi:hypothetical protein
MDKNVSTTSLSTVSVYYDALDHFSEAEITESFLTKVKNKLFNAASFSFSCIPTKIRNRLIKIKDNIASYQEFISNKLDILLGRVKKIKVSIVNMIDRLHILDISFNYTNNYKVTKLE